MLLRILSQLTILLLRRHHYQPLTLLIMRQLVPPNRSTFEAVRSVTPRARTSHRYRTIRVPTTNRSRDGCNASTSSKVSSTNAGRATAGQTINSRAPLTESNKQE